MSDEGVTPEPAAGPSGGSAEANWWRLYVPHADDAAGSRLRSYVRLGMTPRAAAEKTREIEPGLRETMGKGRGFEDWQKGFPGLVLFTDGRRADYAAGDAWQGVGGNAATHVAGDAATWIDGARTVEVGRGNSDAGESPKTTDPAKTVDTLTVLGKQDVTIGGHRELTVSGDDTQTVVGARAVEIGTGNKAAAAESQAGREKVVEETTIYGKRVLTVEGPEEKEVKGARKEVVLAEDLEMKYGYAVSLFFGEKFDLFIGAQQNVALAHSVDINLGVLPNFEFTLGTGIEINATLSLTIELGTGIEISPGGITVTLAGVELESKSIEFKNALTRLATSTADVEVTGNKTIL